MFSVQLTKIDPTTKPKIIKEVKALNPTMSLIDVRFTFLRQRSSHGP